MSFASNEPITLPGLAPPFAFIANSGSIPKCTFGSDKYFSSVASHTCASGAALSHELLAISFQLWAFSIGTVSNRYGFHLSSWQRESVLYAFRKEDNETRYISRFQCSPNIPWILRLQARGSVVGVRLIVWILAIKKSTLHGFQRTDNGWLMKAQSW